MIVFTGLSGSGKSSLAFDTIFAEGQRRYVESLSAYARQFLGQVDKPDVDFIEGLSPAVSIDQKSTSKNPRSTVGTITEIYDYMRLLWARVGRPHCPVCGEPVTKQTPQQIVDQLLELPEGTRFQVLAPVVRGRKGEFVELFKELTAKGYSRARVDDKLIQLSDPPKLGKQFKHTIEVVVDRLVVKDGISQRLTDSVETALGLAEGRILAEFVDLDADDPDRIRAFSEHLACPNEHPLAIDEIEPRSFSFNNPFGACSACSGIGTKLEVDEELIIPNGELSLAEGAIAPWSLGTATTEYWNRLLDGLAKELGLLDEDPVGQALRGHPPDRAARQGPQGRGAVPQPLRPGTQIQHRLRGRHPVRPPQAPGNGLGHGPRPLRGVHAADPVPGLQRRTPEPGVAVGADQRQVDRRGRRPADARMRPLPGQPGAHRPRGPDRPPGPQGDPGPPDLPARRRPGVPEPGTRLPAPCPAAKPSASGWPPRSAPAWWACSTSWTSRPSACTSATTAA